MATTIPRRPMETNIQRQPKEIIRTVSSGGAMVGPSEEAQFQIPVGNPRSRTFHQSRTARAAPENIGASPAPRKTRATTNCQKLPTKPATACASDQTNRPRPNAVGQCSARKLAESISPEECGKQKPHVRDRQAEFLTDQRIGDRERSTVDIVERSGDHEKYKGRSLRPPDAGWNWGGGHHR